MIIFINRNHFHLKALIKHKQNVYQVHNIYLHYFFSLLHSAYCCWTLHCGIDINFCRSTSSSKTQTSKVGIEIKQQWRTKHRKITQYDSQLGSLTNMYLLDV